MLAMASGKAERIDVLIVTAVSEEYEAVIAAGGGEAAWMTWQASTGLGVAARAFEVAGGALRIARRTGSGLVRW